MLGRTKTRTNPVFRPDELELLIGSERAERALHDPDNVDFLVWNVFTTLETHSDPDWLAFRMQAFGGPQMTAPVRCAMWTGAMREPLLRPSSMYTAEIRRRAHAHGGSDSAIADFLTPIEVPVRIETPGVVAVVDASTGRSLRGHGGRDRIVELVDAGLEHARRLGKSLAVAVLYRSGTPAASEASRRMRQLLTPEGLRAAMPYRSEVPTVVLREVTWQQLMRIWYAEREYLELGGLPARRFIDLCRERGLL
jgi:hypothetical protein